MHKLQWGCGIEFGVDRGVGLKCVGVQFWAWNLPLKGCRWRAFFCVRLVWAARALTLDL